MRADTPLNRKNLPVGEVCFGIKTDTMNDFGRSSNFDLFGRRDCLFYFLPKEFFGFEPFISFIPNHHTIAQEDIAIAVALGGIAGGELAGYLSRFIIE